MDEDIWHHINNEEKHIAMKLIKYKGNVDAKCRRSGKTPLMDALFYESDIKRVQFLLDHKADVNAKDNNGCTPLFYATHAMDHFREKDSDFKQNINKSLEVIKLLKSYGAVYDENIKYDLYTNGMTLSNNAILYNKTDIAIMLLKNGRNPFQKRVIDEETPFQLALKLNNHIVIDYILQNCVCQ